jgi:transposase
VEGLQSQSTVAELCTKYEIHQSQYYQWREQFLQNGEDIFKRKNSLSEEEKMKKKIARMEQVIGMLTLELKKND